MFSCLGIFLFGTLIEGLNGGGGGGPFDGWRLKISRFEGWRLNFKLFDGWRLIFRNEVYPHEFKAQIWL